MIASNLWVEKYRPNTLQNIYSQNNVISLLQSTINNKNIPHLIFSGPPGCGKTSTILALAQDIFGVENYKDRIIELNASDERGINIVRDKIKNYAKQSIKTVINIVPWKIIILDEADSMTNDSQFALRRIIEQYSKITRFCLICNYQTKIIEPIISRCFMCKFYPITDDNIKIQLQYICDKEQLPQNSLLFNKISKISNGDLRKAINLLELYYNSNNNNNNTLLDDTAGIIPDLLFNNLIKYISNKDIDKVNDIITNIYSDGYSITNQIILFHKYIINSDLSDTQKSLLSNKLVEIDQNIIKDGDEYIQYLNIIYYMLIII